MKKIKIFFVTIVAGLNIACFTFANDTLKLATTTSTYESGILDYIFPPFEKKYNVKIHIISVGTGKAIRLGENGDVDIILVHDRRSEDRFVQAGYGINRRDVMYNDFVIVGPRDDPAKISGLKSASQALDKVYQTKASFISRGDDSGTDKKEKFLWSTIRLSPQGKWYQSVGQGMTATLLIADEKNAYTLVDRATWLSHKDEMRLVKLVEGDKNLFNPYGVIAVSPYIHPYIKYKLSMALIAWLTSPECQRMISQYTKKGHQLFHPNAKNPVTLQ